MKISVSFSLAATIAGAFIGAGFVSGQELWQFFGCFGATGIIGLILAIFFIALLSYLILRYALVSGSFTFHSLITPSKSKAVKTLLLLIESIFYFCIYIIMTAGARSLMQDSFNIDKTLAGLIFISVVTLISLTDVKKVVSFFSALTPLLTILVLAISIISITKNGIELPKHTSGNVLSMVLSSLLYVSYNFIAGIGVFAALGRIIKSKKTLRSASVLSFVFLILLSSSILLGIFSQSSCAEADLPMLCVAKEIHPVFAFIYSILLILAMTGASISSLFPLGQMLKGTLLKRAVFCTFLSILSIILSAVGFKELVSTIYPIFGYIGFVVILLVVINTINTFKERK